MQSDSKSACGGVSSARPCIDSVWTPVRRRASTTRSTRCCPTCSRCRIHSCTSISALKRSPRNSCICHTISAAAAKWARRKWTLAPSPGSFEPSKRAPPAERLRMRTANDCAPKWRVAVKKTLDRSFARPIGPSLLEDCNRSLLRYRRQITLWASQKIHPIRMIYSYVMSSWVRQFNPIRTIQEIPLAKAE
jgi:hypothetical protein